MDEYKKELLKQFKVILKKAIEIDLCSEMQCPENGCIGCIGDSEFCEGTIENLEEAING